MYLTRRSHCLLSADDKDRKLHQAASHLDLSDHFIGSGEHKPLLQTGHESCSSPNFLEDKNSSDIGEGLP